MNKFFYLDVLGNYNVAFYQIETDLSLHQLKKSLTINQLNRLKKNGRTYLSNINCFISLI